MTREEILDKAIYIQLPYLGKVHYTYNIEGIHKLPSTDMVYAGWKLNEHHLTTEYHFKYTIPLLCNLLHITCNSDVFKLERRYFNNYDISLLAPVKNYRFDVYGYTRGEFFQGISYAELTSNDSKNSDITEFHRLYKYSHECSRIINRSIVSKRKLFVAGDSQIIPVIGYLACCFKEVWYFDNRRNKELHQTWKNENFTDVLIALNGNNSSFYMDKSFK